MKREMQGHYVRETTSGEAVRAFVPAPLPPNPDIVWDAELRERFDEALLALGRLDGLSERLPHAPGDSLVLYAYVRKEAVLSSMIEGTQSSLSDLLRFELDEAPGVPLEDVREVSAYVGALDHGLRRVRSGFPLSTRLLREIHAELMRPGRGARHTPGELRRSQNWIGGTRPGNAAFVPPPAHLVLECMSQLEQFLHDQPTRTSPLLKAGLAHVQFETIHPFLDGNGRVGRLLITLLLCTESVLREPLLYLSLYFKTHRSTYYALLDEVRRSGDWERWLAFFADAVRVTATGAVDTARTLSALTERDEERVRALGRSADTTWQVLRAMTERPIATSPWLVERTGLTAATVNRRLERLGELGIVREITGRERHRVFRYDAYLRTLEAGLEVEA